MAQCKTLKEFTGKMDWMQNASMTEWYDFVEDNSQFLPELDDETLKTIIRRAPAVLEVAQGCGIANERLARICDHDLVREIVNSGYEYAIGYVPVECFDRETIEKALGNTHLPSESEWYDNWEGWNRKVRDEILDRCNELDPALLEKIPGHLVLEWENANKGPEM